jgi:hypothetical protein
LKKSGKRKYDFDRLFCLFFVLFRKEKKKVVEKGKNYEKTLDNRPLL